MKAYLDLLQHILENGEKREDRTNTGTISSFGHQLSFDLEEGFPAVTTKSLAWKGVVSELIWFLEGSSDERRLAEIRFGKNRETFIAERDGLIRQGKKGEAQLATLNEQLVTANKEALSELNNQPTSGITIINPTL